jgi:hypothetical protein
MEAMRNSTDVQARQLVMSQGLAQCQKQLRPIQTAINDQMLARQPGVYAQTLRTSNAIHSADSAGDEPKAFQLAQTMDAQANVIESEAQANPAEARDMRDMLSFAQTEIGKGHEKRGHDAEAAVYYQKAINTMAIANGVGTPAQIRLGFLYANGRGVQRDRGRALELFGGASGEILGTRGHTESAYAYLLNHGKLPYRLEDMRPGLLQSVEAEESARQEAAALQEAAREEARAAAERKANPQYARQQCESGCSSTATFCENNRSFGSFVGSMGGRGIFGGMAAADATQDCSSQRASCLASCSR